MTFHVADPKLGYNPKLLTRDTSLSFYKLDTLMVRKPGSHVYGCLQVKGAKSSEWTEKHMLSLGQHTCCQTWSLLKTSLR